MGNFNGNALAQKIAKKGKNQTLIHYTQRNSTDGVNVIEFTGDKQQLYKAFYTT